MQVLNIKVNNFVNFIKKKLKPENKLYGELVEKFMVNGGIEINKFMVNIAMASQYFGQPPYTTDKHKNLMKDYLKSRDVELNDEDLTKLLRYFELFFKLL